MTHSLECVCRMERKKSNASNDSGEIFNKIKCMFERSVKNSTVCAVRTVPVKNPVVHRGEHTVIKSMEHLLGLSSSPTSFKYSTFVEFFFF